MPTKRERILTALTNRLAAIQPANGYVTDAGLRLFRGPVHLGDNDPLPALSIVSARGEPLEEQTLSGLRALTVTVQGLITASAADPWGQAESLLGDLKRALFVLGDRTLGGLAQEVNYGEDGIGERADGSEEIGVLQEVIVRYAETYGNPD